ncbi:MAG: hypothetical protein JO152_12965 [Mycobacteriaceae bacterium]|nr:hypothetical protein [Mycobacteriaceae bacterium]
MSVVRRRVVRLISAAGVGSAITAAPQLGAPPSVIDHLAMCPRGEVANPAGYGCVPDIGPGGAAGPPSEQVLTACHGANVYFCVDPYAIP